MINFRFVGQLETFIHFHAFLMIIYVCLDDLQAINMFKNDSNDENI